ncbi:hypothetical protein BZM27_02745 [Paraburkholderia steynii]|uniref:Uncharacterized protein n=1 Tax=Paraburkholderia steynii TaxID=1245441 RepID=A0A4R0XQR1_9BURK|nr:hypothetical protein BZM27_02745 [Paraburkholderia steynii]
MMTAAGVLLHRCIVIGSFIIAVNQECAALAGAALFFMIALFVFGDYAVAHRVGAACNIVAAGIHARHATN